MGVKVKIMVETVYEKTIRLLSDYRVQINSKNDHKITAKIIGDSETYNVFVRRDGSFFCGCYRIQFSNHKYAYHQFFNDEPLGMTRILPECSHVLSVKLTSFYKIWVRYHDYLAHHKQQYGYDRLTAEELEHVRIQLYNMIYEETCHDIFLKALIDTNHPYFYNDDKQKFTLEIPPPSPKSKRMMKKRPKEGLLSLDLENMS